MKVHKLLLTFVLGFLVLTIGTFSSVQSTLSAQQLVTNSSNKVDGLSLPASFTVTADEGFVTVKADCKGPVEWIVLTTAQKVKYKVSESDKEVIVSVPTVQCIITIFCYGVVEGKPTKPARCDITVNVGNGDNPKPPEPGPKPVPNVGKLNITIVEDPSKRTQDYTLITRWAITKEELEKLGHKSYLLPFNAPEATDPKYGFDKLIKQFPLPILVIQDEKGKLLGAGPAPKTLDELKRMIAQGK
jgi:hypothetical protein